MENDKWYMLLLEKIQLLPNNVYEFTQIDLQRVDLFSEKATFLTFKLNGVQHERWIPYSQLKKDNNNNLWLSNWLINNMKLNKKSKFPSQETSGEIICN